MTVKPLNLLAMAKRLLRGRLSRRWARAMLRCLEAADSVLLGTAPFLRRYCGEVIVVAEK